MPVEDVALDLCPGATTDDHAIAERGALVVVEEAVLDPGDRRTPPDPLELVGDGHRRPREMEDLVVIEAKAARAVDPDRGDVRLFTRAAARTAEPEVIEPDAVADHPEDRAERAVGRVDQPTGPQPLAIARDAPAIAHQ